MVIEDLSEETLSLLDMLQENGYLHEFLHDAIHHSHSGHIRFRHVISNMKDSDDIEEMIDTCIDWSDAFRRGSGTDWQSVSSDLGE